MKIQSVKLFTSAMLFSLTVVLAFGLMDKAWALPITLSASNDTYITEHAGLGGPTSNHGSDSDLWAMRGTGVFRTFPLVKFDLTALAGSTVNGSTADFRLYLNNAWGGIPGKTQSLSIRPILTNWSETTASFSNFGGSGFNQSTQTGSNLVTQNVTYTGTPGYVSFLIPSPVLQGWIDDSATNFGLIVFSNTPTNQTDLVFSSRESANSPLLSFDATNVAPVPEPSTIFLLGSGLVGLIGFNYRRRKQPV